MNDKYAYFLFYASTLYISKSLETNPTKYKVLKLNNKSVPEGKMLDTLRLLASFVDEGIPRITIEDKGEVECEFIGNDARQITLQNINVDRVIMNLTPDDERYGVPVINNALAVMRDKEFDKAWSENNMDGFHWGLRGYNRPLIDEVYTFEQNADLFIAKGTYVDSPSVIGKKITGDNIFNYLGFSSESLYKDGKWPDWPVNMVLFRLGSSNIQLTAKDIRRYCNIYEIID